MYSYVAYGVLFPKETRRNPAFNVRGLSGFVQHVAGFGLALVQELFGTCPASSRDLIGVLAEICPSLASDWSLRGSCLALVWTLTWPATVCWPSGTSLAIAGVQPALANVFWQPADVSLASDQPGDYNRSFYVTCPETDRHFTGVLPAVGKKHASGNSSP